MLKYYSRISALMSMDYGMGGLAPPYFFTVVIIE